MGRISPTAPPFPGGFCVCASTPPRAKPMHEIGLARNRNRGATFFLFVCCIRVTFEIEYSHHRLIFDKLQSPPSYLPRTTTPHIHSTRSKSIAATMSVERKYLTYNQVQIFFFRFEKLTIIANYLSQRRSINSASSQHRRFSMSSNQIS